MAEDPFSKLFENPPMLSSWYTWAFIALGGVLFGLRAYFRGPQYAGKASISGKVAIVTGANCGMGYEVALSLARRGARVYLACRDEIKGRAASATIAKDSQCTSPDAVHFLPLDLASAKSIRSFASAFLKRESCLHILVNNAGVMLCPKATTEDGFEYHFAANYLGHFLLTQLLSDALRASAPSRVVCTTAPAWRLGRIALHDVNLSDTDYGNGGTAYSQSKLAVLLFARELARRLTGTGVTCNAADPGVVNSNVHRHMAFRSNGLLRVALGPLFWFLMKGPADGAQTSVCLAIDSNLEGVTGKLYRDMQEQPIVAEDATILNDEVASQLWALSEKLTSTESKSID